MRAEFAEGMYEGVDSYTYAVWPADTEEFRKDMTSEFSGVGIVINKVAGQLKVDSLLEDAPAFRVGLDAGDSIVEIDHQSTANITLQMAVRRITGKRGTDVVLTIDREGFAEPRDFTITRDHIVVKTVKGLYRDVKGGWQYFVDPDEGIAYVRLTNFVAESHKSMIKILKSLKDQGMRALILDLRGNGGGFLSSAVEFVDSFVDEGTIVSTRGRIKRLGSIENATTRGTFDADLPLVVLINSASASASEIVSGSLKDHGRALIVGTRSLGKGSVQQIQRLRPSDAELKLTIAYYYLPSGRRVHRDPKDRLNKDYGVEPHISLELTGEHIKEMYKVRREAGILHLNGYKDGESDWHSYTPEEMLASDAQLNMAVLCLRGELVARSLGDHEKVAAEAEPDPAF
jgi:carboxyl-terminal processing protease